MIVIALNRKFGRKIIDPSASSLRYPGFYKPHKVNGKYVFKPEPHLPLHGSLSIEYYEKCNLRPDPLKPAEHRATTLKPRAIAMINDNHSLLDALDGNRNHNNRRSALNQNDDEDFFSDDHDHSDNDHHSDNDYGDEDSDLGNDEEEKAEIAINIEEENNALESINVEDDGELFAVDIDPDNMTQHPSSSNHRVGSRDWKVFGAAASGEVIREKFDFLNFELSNKGVHKVMYKHRYGVVIFSCTSTECIQRFKAIKRHHNRSNIYYVYYENTGEFVQKCFSSKCNREASFIRNLYELDDVRPNHWTLAQKFAQDNAEHVYHRMSDDKGGNWYTRKDSCYTLDIGGKELKTKISTGFCKKLLNAVDKQRKRKSWTKGTLKAFTKKREHIEKKTRSAPQKKNIITELQTIQQHSKQLNSNNDGLFLFSGPNAKHGEHDYVLFDIWEGCTRDMKDHETITNEKRTSMVYKPKEECTEEIAEIRKFLNEVLPRKKDLEYKLIFDSLSLTDLRVKTILFNVGEGDNGKTAYHELLHYVIGAYSFVGGQENIKPNGDSTIRSAMANKRHMLLDDIDHSIPWSEAAIKQLCGTGKFCCRQIYSMETEKDNYVTINILLNQMPFLDMKGTAMKTRIELLDWPSRFVSPTNVEHPPVDPAKFIFEAKQYYTTAEFREKYGIGLFWILHESLMKLKQNEFKLTRTPNMAQRRNQFLGKRSKSEFFDVFFDKHWIVTGNNKDFVEQDKIYSLFHQEHYDIDLTQQIGIDKNKVNEYIFQQLERKGCLRKPSVTRKKIRIYRVWTRLQSKNGRANISDTPTNSQNQNSSSSPAHSIYSNDNRNRNHNRNCSQRTNANDSSSNSSYLNDPSSINEPQILNDSSSIQIAENSDTSSKRELFEDSDDSDMDLDIDIIEANNNHKQIDCADNSDNDVVVDINKGNKNMKQTIGRKRKASFILNQSGKRRKIS